MAATPFRCAALALGLVLAPSLAAQVVRGAVLDERTQQPLDGAIVVLIDSAGARVAGAISDASGRFALRAPAAGTFALRADRIGYASAISEPFALGAGATVERRVLASSVPIVLDTVAVHGRNRCVVHPREGEETARLWQEARKALYATQLSAEAQRVHVTIREYSRILDPYTMGVRAEQTRTRSGYTVQPFRTNHTPEELARSGWRQDSELVGPDADVLLSNVFADTHCFRLRRDARDHPGLVGLAFEPARKQNLPDVTGVLWLDDHTAELKYLEFRHTNLFPQLPPTAYGGRVFFERLPSGAWLIRSWYIRTPDFAVGPDQAHQPGDLRDIAGKTSVAGFHEDGGEVVAIDTLHEPTP